MVPVADVEALVDAMVRFIEDPELILTMGQEGRRIAEECYDVRSVNSALIGFLEGAEGRCGFQNSV